MLIYLYSSLVYDLYLFRTQKIYKDFSSYSSLAKISLIVYPSKQGIVKKVSKSGSLMTHSSLTQNSQITLFGVIKHSNPLYENSISSFIAVNDTLRMYKNDDIRMYNFNCITDTIVEVITTCNTYTLLTVHLL